jgi:hypothetical protein
MACGDVVLVRRDRVRVEVAVLDMCDSPVSFWVIVTAVIVKGSCERS